MADPFRLTLMKAISTTLKSISPENEYIHDMSDFTDSAGRENCERVFRGRTEFGDNDPIPALAVLEDPRGADTTTGTAAGVSVNPFRVLIQGFVADDKDHPLDPAYMLSAEVIQALVKMKMRRHDILGLGSRAPCVTNMVIGQPVHRPGDDEISDRAYFLVPVTLTLAEDLEKPFPSP